MSHMMELRARRARVGIWGLGRIGLIALERFVSSGIECIGFDIDADRVREINSRSMPSLTSLSPPQKLDLATADIRQMQKPDVIVHIVCVPSEVDGSPHFEAIRDVCVSIVEGECLLPLIIVESTLAPGTSDKLILPSILMSREANNFLYAVAPRRDWIDDGEREYTSAHRVVGANTQADLNAAISVLGLVYTSLHECESASVAEMVKCVENAYRYLDITFANQLALAFPDLNIREALRLAGTKWNMNTYFPSLKPSGHCIPVAARHLLTVPGARERLTLLDDCIKYEPQVAKAIAQALSARAISSVLVIGYSYSSAAAIFVNSPAQFLIPSLQEYGMKVAVYDPLFKPDQLVEKAGCLIETTLEARSYDCIVVLTCPKWMQDEMRRANTLSKWTNLTCVVDATGIWKNHPLPPHVSYSCIGDGTLLNG